MQSWRFLRIIGVINYLTGLRVMMASKYITSFRNDDWIWWQVYIRRGMMLTSINRRLSRLFVYNNASSFANISTMIRISYKLSDMIIVWPDKKTLLLGFANNGFNVLYLFWFIEEVVKFQIFKRFIFFLIY